MGTSRPQRAWRNHIEKNRDLGYSYRWGLLINNVSNLFLEILTEWAVTMEDLLTHPRRTRLRRREWITGKTIALADQLQLAKTHRAPNQQELRKQTMRSLWRDRKAIGEVTERVLILD